MDAVDANEIATLNINVIERWNVFNRLRELAIPCACACGQPLQVEVATAADAIQVWSVVRQFTLPRDVAIDHLETCWRQTIYS